MTLLAHEYISPSEYVKRYDVPVPIANNLNPALVSFMQQYEKRGGMLQLTQKHVEHILHNASGRYVPVGYYVFTDAKRRINPEVCEIIWKSTALQARQAVMSSLLLDYLKDDLLSGLSRQSVHQIRQLSLLSSTQKQQLEEVCAKVERFNEKAQKTGKQKIRYLPKTIDTQFTTIADVLRKFADSLSEEQVNGLFNVLHKKEKKFAVAAIAEPAKKQAIERVFSQPDSISEIEDRLYSKAKLHMVSEHIPLLSTDEQHIDTIRKTHEEAKNLKADKLHKKRVLNVMSQEKAEAIYEHMPEEERHAMLKTYIAEQIKGVDAKGNPIRNHIVSMFVHPNDVALFHTYYPRGMEEEVSLPEQQAVKDMLERTVTVKTYPHNRAPANNPIKVTPGKQAAMALLYPSTASCQPIMQVMKQMSAAQIDKMKALGITDVDPIIPLNIGDVNNRDSRCNPMDESWTYIDVLHGVCHTLHLEHNNNIFDKEYTKSYVETPLTSKHTRKWLKEPSWLEQFLDALIAPFVWVAKAIGSLFTGSSEEKQRAPSEQQQKEKAQVQNAPNQPQKTLQHTNDNNRTWQQHVAQTRTEAQHAARAA